MWLHVVVEHAGAVIFESGRVDARGSLVDGTGKPLPHQPHRDEILSADEVQVWEATLVDRAGEPTHRALAARRFDKDDRILPLGFAPDSIDAPRVEPIAVIADASFVAGADTVTFRVPGIPSGATIRVELKYQTVSPERVDALAATPTPAGQRFVGFVTTRPAITVGDRARVACLISASPTAQRSALLAVVIAP